ncbi:MAG: hypothetical protein ABSH20_07650 [Tepidisphaeraceae bacterium]|jgi:hypothetical protein
MKRSRAPIAMLLVLSLLLSGVFQNLVRGRRGLIVQQQASLSRLSGLDSFTLGLILGGLRGPLVIALWINVETQKTERDLQNVDTMIELIRMLQPEFDQVHIFEIWNKAYNLSVQMTSIPNKYATILDALDYAHRVDAERPDNINILTSIAEVYFNKLGTSSEKRVFTEHMMEETKASKRPSAPAGRSSVIRQQHESLLTPEGRIKPELLTPRLAVPLGEYNGAELQFLEPFSKAEGFPYGVPPLAMSYNYYRRAGALMRGSTQRHAQLSDSVTDSRAAIALRYWADSEDEEALRNECAAMGRKTPEARAGLEAVTADVAIGTRFPDTSEQTRQTVECAIFDFARAHDIAERSLVEYRRHIAEKMFSSEVSTFQSHLEEMQALADMTAGEHDYLRLLAAEGGLIPLKPGESPATLRQSATKSYELARDQFYRIMLLRYVDDYVTQRVYPRFTREKLGKVWTKQQLWQADPAIYPLLTQEVLAEAKQIKWKVLSVDVEEYLAYLARVETRLALLKK